MGIRGSQSRACMKQTCGGMLAGRFFTTLRTMWDPHLSAMTQNTSFWNPSRISLRRYSKLFLKGLHHHLRSMQLPILHLHIRPIRHRTVFGIARYHMDVQVGRDGSARVGPHVDPHIIRPRTSGLHDHLRAKRMQVARRSSQGTHTMTPHENA